ncbi:type II secretion system F family protein [Amycolatopsis aidingensis]|uniref:type II secretion system F family protein n=1 Tax=Amycolatopsis aidingensis TaxID=2842453 RepID=UPI001C0AA561|nr:pilus assembly protein TadB [Amycolatopsis aidingensis]
MLTWSALAAGCALLCWPGRTAASRLRALPGVSTRTRRNLRAPRSSAPAWLAAVAAFGTCAALFGPGPVLAVGLLGIAAWLARRSRARLRTCTGALAALAESLRAVVAELRAGTHPAVAAESVATDAAEAPAAVLQALAGAVRMGGEFVLPAEAGPAVRRIPAEVLGQLRAAWELARRHGVPVAEVLDAVRRDLDAAVRFAGQAEARMAGPRAGAAVLAALPACGILLGEAMGAGPLHVLTATPLGHLLSIAGAGLICLGMAWTTRMTGRVVL